jgi:hypothetical protein
MVLQKDLGFTCLGGTQFRQDQGPNLRAWPILLAQAEAGPVNSTKLVHVNAISNIYKINIQGSISRRAGIYLAYINGQDQLGRFDIILQYLVHSTRLWPKMFHL